MKRVLIAACCAGFLASCAAPKVLPLYYWGNYENASYQAVKTKSDADTKKLIATYEDMFKNQTKGSRGIPPPGICADYGFLLMSTGKDQEGRTWLARETTLYPESKMFIDRILKMYDNGKTTGK